MFRVHARALAAYVGVRGGIDPEAPAKAVLHAGDELIAATPRPDPQGPTPVGPRHGPVRRRANLPDAHRARRSPEVRRTGRGISGAGRAKRKPTPHRRSLLGRLYFRLGAIHAIARARPQAAVAWFDKAVPLLDTRLPDEAAADLGRHGETFVSMGVSYWEVGQREKAVELTEKGIAWMEQAVKQGTLDRSALAVPYDNLAAMHRKLGATDVADRYQEMATRIKSEKLK